MGGFWSKRNLMWAALLVVCNCVTCSVGRTVRTWVSIVGRLREVAFGVVWVVKVPVCRGCMRSWSKARALQCVVLP